MRNQLVNAAFAILAMCIAANVAAAPIFLHCARLIDVRSLEVLTERTIIVEDKKIVRVDTGYTAASDGGAVAPRGHTCMPGLIDLHVHLSCSLTPESMVEGFTFNPAWSLGRTTT